MRRKWLAAACALSLFVALMSDVPATAAPSTGSSKLDVYVGDLTPAQFEVLRSLGLDAEDLVSAPGKDGLIHVEPILSQLQVSRMKSKGIPLAAKTIRGKTSSDVMRSQLAAGQTVFRTYSEPGGIR